MTSSGDVPWRIEALNKDHIAFLCAGLAFGTVLGFGLFQANESRPKLTDAQASTSGIPAPQGPAAPNQIVGGGSAGVGGAPMVRQINDLKRALQQDPKSLEILVRLANLYHDAGIWPEAASYYERAVAVSPTNPDLLTDLGICYRGMREFDRALESFDKAQKIDSSHWQSLFNTVVVAGFDLKKMDLAMEALRSMEVIQPRPAELTADRLAQLRQALERIESAPPDAGSS